DLGREGDTLFLVTDYVAGTDLRRLVTAQGPLPWREAASYARQAALGLQHACEQGVVHRDVKPSNLILTADGTVKVLDLGLARLLLGNDEGPPPTLLTPNGMVLGTPDFAAPEQLGGSPADTRSDVYSLGCTLHFLLAGEPPFPGGDVWSKVLRHHSSSAPALTELRPDVPAELAATVVRMMEKDPCRRYQTPGEAAAALALFCR
ncbi:MAG TPA: serine/threonine-protein kinase, partial [Gemmataceae bacterium]|nr:serine/threonine-protein kinase [Gemmataceae bacterium]